MTKITILHKLGLTKIVIGIFEVWQEKKKIIKESPLLIIINIPILFFVANFHHFAVFLRKNGDFLSPAKIPNSKVKN
jgi:hypothetical protein